MRPIVPLLSLAAGLGVLASISVAQSPPRAPAGGANPSMIEAIVARIMVFDKNKDGKLSRAEVSDERLLLLFDRADGNKDGVVTKEELTALAAQMAAEEPA